MVVVINCSSVVMVRITADRMSVTPEPVKSESDCRLLPAKDPDRARQVYTVDGI